MTDHAEQAAHYLAQADHATDLAELKRLREEVALLQKDADRYRWLRNSSGDSTVGVYQNGQHGRWWIEGDEMDAAIDNAIAKASK